MNIFKDEVGVKYVNLSPDQEIIDEKNRAYQGCPTVAVTKGGRVFAGWYTGGAYEPCIYNYNVLVMSDDGGESWSKPILTVERDEKLLVRNIDIQLWVTKENHLWVMWTRTPYYSDSNPAAIKYHKPQNYHAEFWDTEVMICRDPDADVLVWETPFVLCDGFMRCKPIQTASGRIIAPAYDFHAEIYTLRLSDDGGKTFRTVCVKGKPDRGVFDEITLYQNESGRIRFLARTVRGHYVYSDSFDDGESWTDAVEYEKATSSRCFIGTLKNGEVVYVRNHSDLYRDGIRICLSEDGGETFPYQMILEGRSGVSYPDVDQDADGNIYIVHDRERDNRCKLNKETWVSEAAKEILISKVTVQDIKSGTLSEGSFLSRVISKGLKNLVEE